MEVGSGHSDFRLEQHQLHHNAEAATKAEQLHNLVQHLVGCHANFSSHHLRNRRLNFKVRHLIPFQQPSWLRPGMCRQVFQSHISAKQYEMSTLTSPTQHVRRYQILYLHTKSHSERHYTPDMSASGSATRADVTLVHFGFSVLICICKWAKYTKFI